MSEDSRPLHLRPLRWFGFLASVGVSAAVLYALPTELPETVDVEAGRWTSMMPPLVAVLAAVFFRRLLLALGGGVLLGSLLHHGVDMPAGFRDYLWVNVADPFNLYILGFTFTLVGMVNVMSRAGGTHGLVEVIRKVARRPRSTRVATGLMGLAIFFDDYANSVVIGTTMRKLTDRMHISREKLAYIVDSTAAPIAGLTLVSTWIAFEVSLFQEMGDQLGLGIGGYQMFLNVLPYRFYCLAALVMVFAGAATRRDFGPMFEAEERAAHTGQLLHPDAEPMGTEVLDQIQPPEDAPLRWFNAVIPVAVVLVGVVGGMLWSGRGAVAEEGHAFSLLDGTTWRLAFGGADSAQVLFWVSVAGSLVAIGLAVGQRILPLREALHAWVLTFRAMWLAVTILILAWAIKSVCESLHTDGFLIAVLGGEMPLTALPLVTFLLAALVAFSTGTSFGTMGILIPVVLPLAHALDATEQGQLVFFWLTGAAVLDGAIFGDHCSPLSDTTVLSSAASGCDHIEHVRTQVPYAVTGMVLAGSLGYLAVAFGLPRAASWGLIPVAAVVVYYTLGRRVPNPEEFARG
ncbi:MAG: Na+/H+ antiporter NhaC family protein [Myxococcota bacterium]